MRSNKVKQLHNRPDNFSGRVLGLYPGRFRISSVTGNGSSSVGRFLRLRLELLSSCSKSQMSLSTELMRAVRLMSTLPPVVVAAIVGVAPLKMVSSWCNGSYEMSSEKERKNSLK